MSWRQIAAKTNPSAIKHKSKLTVKNNINVKTATSTTKDNIPRHRELTPDPSDDFLMTNGNVQPQTTVNQGKQKKIIANDSPINSGGFVDYTKNSRLRRFKKRLPLSVQRIVEFANKLYIDNIVVSLNFQEIAQDLKYQYKKYNGNQSKLKKIYSYDKTYSMLLKSATFLHFLFKYLLVRNVNTIPNKLSNDDKVKMMKQMLKMIKLLVSNKIIDIQVLYANFGCTAWELIKPLPCVHNKEKYSNKIMDDVVDLIIVCLNDKEFEEQEAIIRIVHSFYEYDDNDPNPRTDENDIYYLNLMESEVRIMETKMCNTNQVIDKLLFRGMMPFQFIEKKVKIVYNARNANRKSVITMNYKQPVTTSDTKQYITSVMEEEKIFDNTVSDRYEQQLIILSSLALIPHLDRAKHMMHDILTESVINNSYIKSETLTNDICKVLINYLYVDYQYFYDIKQIQNNINAKVVLFLSTFLHLEIDNNFTKLFEERYCDKDFIKHLFENYLKRFMDTITDNTYGENAKLTYQFLLNFITTCNKYQGIKFPLENGIYKVLSLMIGYDYRSDVCIDFDHWNRKVIHFLKYIKKCYKEEFDINFSMMTNDSIVRTNDSILTALISEYDYNKCGKMFKFILEEFKNEYDVNNACLLYVALKYKRIKIFAYLVTKHPRYTLEDICDTLLKMIKENANIYNNAKWRRYNDEDSWLFLDLLERFCLLFLCQSDEDKELMQKSIRIAWKLYGKKCQLRWKTYSVDTYVNRWKLMKLKWFVTELNCEKKEFTTNTHGIDRKVLKNETNIEADFKKTYIPNVYQQRISKTQKSASIRYVFLLCCVISIICFYVFILISAYLD